MIKKFVTWLYLLVHKNDSSKCAEDPSYKHSYGVNLNALNNSIYTMGGNNITMTVKVPTMPASMEQFSPKEIQEAAFALNNSKVTYPVNALNELATTGTQLKDWEIKYVDEAYANFAAKYNSPLAKAMK